MTDLNEKSFWRAIKENDYAVPEGHTASTLMPKLLEFLGSTDPELRDELAYMILAYWIERQLLSPEEMRWMITQLSKNLHIDLEPGEDSQDQVFLRSFSVLMLAELVHHDNKQPYLEADEIRTIFERGLAYLAAEIDPRGYVPDKGWAHALAHTADLLMVLGQNRYLNAADLRSILDSIVIKLVNATNWLYIHNEDERLSRAVIEILKRDLLPITDLQAWLDQFVSPNRGDWKGALRDENAVRAFHNTRNFLRSLHVRLSSTDDLPDQEKIQPIVLQALLDLKLF